MSKSMVPICTIERVYSTMPNKMTDPRSTMRISTSNELLGDHVILQKRMHIVIYYKKPSEEGDSGWLHVAGWIKASLGKALDEHPILAGRLRRSTEEDGGALGVVSNDSGVRCVDAQVPLGLVDFLESKEKNEVDEAQLVYWTDVDETNLQYSPLFYVQVTNFRCGGYSIGISFSLLLADPLFMAKFLNKWASLHTSMAYKSNVPITPIFNTLNLKRIGCSPPAPSNISHTNMKASKTIVYKICIDEHLHSSGDEICKYFVSLCLEEVESKYINNMSSNIALIIKEPNGDAKVEQLSFQKAILGSPKSLRYELTLHSLEEFKLNEILFQRENMPFYTSNWIAYDGIEGVILVVLSCPSEGKSTMMVYINFLGSEEINSA